MIIETRSAKETYDLGKKIGSHAKAGEVYTLVGDLGVGKTVFTQGLAKGLGIEEPPSSSIIRIVAGAKRQSGSCCGCSQTFC